MARAQTSPAKAYVLLATGKMAPRTGLGGSLLMLALSALFRTRL